MKQVHLNKFTLANKERFDRMYARLNFPLAEHSFSWIYLWQGCYKDVEWTSINDNLCLFITFENSRYLWGPPLPGNKLSETLKECFALCLEYNKNHNFEEIPEVVYIPEELKKAYEPLEGFSLREQNQDYIYKISDIIGLKGDKYKSQRNMRNYFLKNYESAVEEYSATRHKKGCRDLLEKWYQHKIKKISKNDKKKLDLEFEASKKVLEHAEELRLKGVVVFVNGKVEGFSFGEQTNKNICTDFFEKCNPTVKGLSTFIYGELLKLFSGEWVNAGEDWNVSYLKNTKLHYKPEMIKNSYRLIRNKA